MAELRRVPVADRMWLMAALKDALDGGAPLQPIMSDDAPEAPELLPQTALVIHTSGSSGTPKFVAHSAESIRAGAEATNETLGGAGQWLIALPTHLIAGLQMLSRSLLGGTEPLFLAGKFSPKKFIELAAHMGEERRYTSLVPVQLAALLEYAQARPEALRVMQRFDAILVGGQAVPLAMRAACHEHGLTVVRTYGMTETGGGVVYDGVEIGDTRVRIRGGEVQLAGSSLALGYLGDEALTDRCFFEEEGTRWYRTGDAGSLLGGVLQVSGRLDRVLVSGGVNVSLDRVERCVEEQAGWHTPTAAVTVEHETWGARPVLFAEAPNSSEEQRLRAEFTPLRERIGEELGPAARPDELHTVQSLPRLANGKIDYRQLTDLLEKDAT